MTAPASVLVRCAWCQPTAASNEMVSHGICPTCAAKMEAELLNTPQLEQTR